jgi:hypothetical protein
MKKYILFLLILTVSFDAPKQDAYDVGEWFKFRIHYGIVKHGICNARGQRCRNK